MRSESGTSPPTSARQDPKCRVLADKVLQGLVDGQETVRVGIHRQMHLLQIKPPPISPALEQAIFPRGIDEDLPHRLRGGGEKVASALPIPLFGSSQAQPGFVNESGGLEGVSGRLVPHFQGRKASQLFVDQREQFLGGLGLALPHSIENARNVVHEVTS